jgi:hypothetical protein
MTARPIALVAAVVLMAIIGVGVTFVGLLMLAVAAGAVALLSPAGGVLGFVGLLGVGSLVAGLIVFIVAGGLWIGRAWGWVASLAVAAVSVIGAIVAISTAGAQVPLQLGLVLCAGTVALLLAPSTREAIRV